MSAAADRLAIEDLALDAVDAEARILELESDCRAYRALAQESIHRLHELTGDLATARRHISHLREQLRILVSAERGIIAARQRRAAA